MSLCHGNMQASATECELIKAIRCQNDARLLRPRFPPAAEDKPFALPRSDGLRCRIAHSHLCYL